MIAKSIKLDQSIYIEIIIVYYNQKKLHIDIKLEEKKTFFFRLY